jgi:hypothetical protein
MAAVASYEQKENPERMPCYTVIQTGAEKLRSV